MNVTLSKRGSYAARAAICLARAYDSGVPKKLREISAEMDIPRTFVSQILGDLVHAGIAVSSFGRAGGHRLSRPPSQVSVAEVVEAAEGSLVSERCALGDGPCRWQSVCPLHETMTTATASLREVLAATTLATLAERDQAIESGDYPLPADAHPHHPTVIVNDSVHVELGAPAVRSRIAAGSGWLTRQGEACDDDPARPQTQTLSDWLGKTVAVYLGEPIQDEGVLALPLIWEAAGPTGLFPRFEGELRLSGIDPDRCELSLSGQYRLPLGPAVPAPDEAVLARAGQSTIRSFLRRLARAIEEDAEPRRTGVYAD